jgi:hypothetical protein
VIGEHQPHRRSQVAELASPANSQIDGLANELRRPAKKRPISGNQRPAEDMKRPPMPSARDRKRAADGEQVSKSSTGAPERHHGNGAVKPTRSNPAANRPGARNRPRRASPTRRCRTSSVRRLLSHVVDKFNKQAKQGYKPPHRQQVMKFNNTPTPGAPREGQTVMPLITK